MATYNISTLAELQAMSSHLADDCVLLNDIDASATRTWNAIGTTGAYYGFLPIGSNAAQFTGTFDGGGFTISNLYINRQGTSSPTQSGWYVGFFGRLSIAGTNFIKNITLKNINFSGKDCLGGLVGSASGNAATCIFSNCTVEGILNWYPTSGEIALRACGGIVGYCGLTGATPVLTFNDCTTSISFNTSGLTGVDSNDYRGVGGFSGQSGNVAYNRCSANGSISIVGANSYFSAGGFCGVGSGGGGSIYTDCTTSVVISENSASVSQINYIGGFVGQIEASGTYTTCYSTGAIIVSSSGSFIVGGFNAGTITAVNECAAFGDILCPNVTTLTAGGFSGDGSVSTNCFARGSVCESKLSDLSAKIGGFSGTSGGNLTNCYSTGGVNPNSSYSGGFIGQKTAGTNSACHWDKETSGLSVGVGGGGVQTGVTGNTTAEMKLLATFTGWDFTTIWDLLTYIQAGTSASNLTVWLGRVGDYENFEEGVNDDDAFSLQLQTENEIRWMAALEALLIGTAGDEWRIASSKLDTPLTPTNFTVKQQSEYGSNHIQPVKINASLLFVDYVARRLRETTYSPSSEKYESPDMTALAEHITLSGITSIARQKNPDSIMWMTLGDGSLISMTYERDQNVIAWAKHPLGGDGFAQSVCVIPGATEDEICLTIQRTFFGQPVLYNGEQVTYEGEDVYYGIGQRTYIEKMAPRVFTAKADAFFVDSGIIFTSVTATSTITGLSHLEGEVVKVLGTGSVIGNGIVLDDATVSSGQITAKLSGVAVTVTKVQVGLPYTYKVQPQRIVTNTPGGSSMGKTTHLNGLVVSFLNSLGAKYGINTTDLVPFDFADNRATNSASITGLFSGELAVPVPGNYDPLNPIIISGDDPLPCCVRCIVADIEKTG